MARKTIRVADVKALANNMLANSDPELVEERRGIIATVEGVLHLVDDYRGFQYLPSEFLPAEEQTAENVLRPNYDDTRRRYY